MRLSANALITLIFGLLESQIIEGAHDRVQALNREFVIIAPPMTRASAADACVAHGWRLARVTGDNLARVSKALRQAGADSGWINSFDGSQPREEDHQALLLRSSNEYCRLDTVATIPQKQSAVLGALHSAICEVIIPHNSEKASRRHKKAHRHHKKKTIDDDDDDGESVEEIFEETDDQRIHEARHKAKKSKKLARSKKSKSSKVKNDLVQEAGKKKHHHPKKNTFVIYDAYPSNSEGEEKQNQVGKKQRQKHQHDDSDQVILIPKHVERLLRRHNRDNKSELVTPLDKEQLKQTTSRRNILREKPREQKEKRLNEGHGQENSTPQQLQSSTNSAGILPTPSPSRDHALIEGKLLIPRRRCPGCRRPRRRCRSQSQSRNRNRRRRRSSSSSSSSDPSSSSSTSSSSSSSTSSKPCRRRRQCGRRSSRGRDRFRTVEGKDKKLGNRRDGKSKAPHLDLKMLDNLVNQVSPSEKSASTSTDNRQVIYVRRRNRDPPREGKRKKQQNEKACKKRKHTKKKESVECKDPRQVQKKRPLLPVRRRHRERSRSSSSESDTLSYSSFAEQVYASSSDGPAAIFRNRRLYRHLHRESSSSSSSSGSQSPILPGLGMVSALGQGAGAGVGVVGETIGRNLTSKLLAKTSKKLALASKHADMETLRAQRRAKSDLRREERANRLTERQKRQSARKTRTDEKGNGSNTTNNTNLKEDPKQDTTSNSKQVHFEEQHKQPNSNTQNLSNNSRPTGEQPSTLPTSVSLKSLDEDAYTKN